VNEIYPPFIQAYDLSKHYTLGQINVKALDNVNLQINEGEMVIILGPSGSGKSTLINMIGGIDSPDHGKIIINGNELQTLTSKELTIFRRKYVGFVFQFYSLIPTLTALENVVLAAELVELKGKELRKRGMDVLNAVGLRGRENSYPSQLSGGERQRVALARALAKHPQIILVDEPTGQLDEETGIQMIELIKETAKLFNSTVLMVTHDKSLIKYADQVIEMKSGRILVKNFE